MNKETYKGWYANKLSDMDVIRIAESDDWIVDYDKSRGMYRVSYFQDNHFKDEIWFDAYEEKEINKENEKFRRKLRKNIAEQVEDKMCYMGTCPNERDMILNIISDDYPRLEQIHCNTDCWIKNCESYRVK